MDTFELARKEPLRLMPGQVNGSIHAETAYGAEQ